MMIFQNYKIEDIMKEDLSPKDERNPDNQKKSNDPSSSSDGQGNVNNDDGPENESETGRKRSLRKRKGGPVCYAGKPRKTPKLDKDSRKRR